MRRLRGIVKWSVDLERPASGKFSRDFHAHEKNHQADQPAERNTASPNLQGWRRQPKERHARQPTS